MKVLCYLLGSIAFSATAMAVDPSALPGTEPLTWTDELSAKMHLAALEEVDKVIDSSLASRAGLWKRDTSSAAAYVR